MPHYGKKSLFWCRLRLGTEFSQSQKIVYLVGALTVLACVVHIFLGANPFVIGTAGLIVLLTIYPIFILGFLNIGAVSIGLVGFRYVGFPLFAKIFFGHPLDSNLFDPLGSFGVVLIGIIGYSGALIICINSSLGRPILSPVLSPKVLDRISFISAAIGITANLFVALKAGEQHTGTTIAEFFVPILQLSMISSTAKIIQKTNGNRSIDIWIVILAAIGIEFAIINNSRIAIMETVLCWVVTCVAFDAKIKWRHLLIIIFSMIIITVFITPIFLRVRDFRSDLSWFERTLKTVETTTNWSETYNHYEDWRQISKEKEWYRNYYGCVQNVFERFSYINNVDILKRGIDATGLLGIEDLVIAAKRAIPRFLAPDKPLGYGQGSWLFSNIGILNPGPYPTAPLIGTGYAAFGWVGAFCYPCILGLFWLIIIKKISSLNIQMNIWAVYLLLRIHNQFVEGSSDAYVVSILRNFPQELILLYIFKTFAYGNFIVPIHRKAYKN